MKCQNLKLLILAISDAPVVRNDLNLRLAPQTPNNKEDKPLAVCLQSETPTVYAVGVYFYFSSSSGFKNGFILFAHRHIVDILCKSADVTGDITPVIPKRISPLLKTDVNL